MNIRDYFAPTDGSSKIASYFELEAAFKAQANANASASVIKQPISVNPVEVKTTPLAIVEKVKKEGFSTTTKLVLGVSVLLIGTFLYLDYQKRKRNSA